LARAMVDVVVRETETGDRAGVVLENRDIRAIGIIGHDRQHPPL
jgi:hypothetical protein